MEEDIMTVFNFNWCSAERLWAWW